MHNDELDNDDDIDFEEEDGYDPDEAVRRRHRRRAIRNAVLNIVMAAVVVGALTIQSRALVPGTFATELTLNLFRVENIAKFVAQLTKMDEQYDLQKRHWDFRTFVTAAEITQDLVTIYGQLAKRHGYRDIGFTWEVSDRAYGNVKDLLDLAEGKTSPGETERILRENAYISYYDMATDRQQKTFVPDKVPGAALEYAAIAAASKNQQMAGKIWKEMEEHRRSAEAVTRLLGKIWLGPERTQQILGKLKELEMLMNTNAAEHRSIEASNAALVEQLRIYRERLANHAAPFQRTYEMETQSNQFERDPLPVYGHVVRP